MKQADITISGGGVAGLALAVLLGDVGLNVHVIDPAPPPPFKKVKPSGRTVALMDNSLNIIKATGTWDKLESHSGALETMRIIDDSIAARDPLHSEFRAEEIKLEQFGFNIPNDLLRSALFEKAKSIKAITLHTPNTLEDYKAETHAVTSTLSDGTQIQSRLLIGADGRSSKTRELACIKTNTHAYGQNAITCLINHSRSHDSISTEFHRPGGPFALVPLPGNQSSVVWVEKSERAEELIKLKEQEFTATLQTQTNDILGAITLETGPQTWPLQSLHALSLTAPRMALMAEAAHVMSPITAQGLNLSLRDVAALAETIIDACRLGLDPGSKSILDRYENRRRIDIRTRIFGVDGMNRIVSQELMSMRGLRRTGLKTLEALPPLKHFAMRHGLAPDIDKSRLAAGEKL